MLIIEKWPDAGGHVTTNITHMHYNQACSFNTTYMMHASVYLKVNRMRKNANAAVRVDEMRITASDRELNGAGLGHYQSRPRTDDEHTISHLHPCNIAIFRLVFQNDARAQDKCI